MPEEGISVSSKVHSQSKTSPGDMDIIVVISSEGSENPTSSTPLVTFHPEAIEKVVSTEMDSPPPVIEPASASVRSWLATLVTEVSMACRRLSASRYSVCTTAMFSMFSHEMEPAMSISAMASSQR